MLNLAAFGAAEHRIMIQAGIDGLSDILELEADAFRERVVRGAHELGWDPPDELTIDGWWQQARTLEEE